MPAWIQLLNGGIGVAIVSGIFGVIMARSNKKADEKADLKEITVQKFEEMIALFESLNTKILEQSMIIREQIKSQSLLREVRSCFDEVIIMSEHDIVYIIKNRKRYESEIHILCDCTDELNTHEISDTLCVNNHGYDGHDVIKTEAVFVGYI